MIPRPLDHGLSEQEPPIVGEVRLAMGQPVRTLPEGFLYDAPGLALFERIGSLPSYGAIRAEVELLSRHRCAIWNAAGCPTEMLEFDAGNAIRSRPLVDLADRYAVADRCYPVLKDAVEGLRRSFPATSFRPIYGDRNAASLHLSASDEPRLCLWLGSGVCRLAPSEARLALASIRTQMNLDDRLLLTVDLAKEDEDLRRAYGDEQGFHAPLIRNALRRLNREIQTSFEIANWIPEIEVQEDRGRVEFRLRTTESTEVYGGRTGAHWHFDLDETIIVEHAYKPTEGQMAALLVSAGFCIVECWIDPNWEFAAFLVAP